MIAYYMRHPLIVSTPVIVFIMAVIFTSGCSGLKPVDAAFPLTFDEAWQAEREMRQHPLPLQRPLVIIGGFADVNVSPPLYAAYFHRMTGDRRIVTVSVGLCQSFASCRKVVIDAVDKAYPSNDPVWTTEVDVVGASLGGLVARYANASSDDPARPRRLKIARLFSISSPHAGSYLANVIAITQFHNDLRSRSEFLKRLAKQDAAASYRLFPYVLLHDGIVGAKYAAPPGQNVFWLPNPPLMPAHFEAMMDARILADISRRLRGQKAFTLPPALPLPDTNAASVTTG